MFSSFGDALKKGATSASDIASSTASSAAAVAKASAAKITPDEVMCSNSTDSNHHPKCKRNISTATLYGRSVSSNQCKRCTKLFCSECITKSAFRVPDNEMASQFQGKSTTTVAASFATATTPATAHHQYMCDECMTDVSEVVMTMFTKEVEEIYQPIFEQYLAAVKVTTHRK
jgi:hypothetical protein